tara:strand:- start:179 stop:352 length:174 start_codon:yes stop_codon:yes gene_type:complete
MANKMSNEEMEALKVEASKKKEALNNVKYGLELGLKKGAFSTLEEIEAVVGSFKYLK